MPIPSLGALRQTPILHIQRRDPPSVRAGDSLSNLRRRHSLGPVTPAWRVQTPHRAWNLAATCRVWLPPKVVLKMLLCPLSATHPAWWHAALMPPSHCMLWSLVLGDIHPRVFLTWPHVIAQSLHSSLCAAPVLVSLESTVRGSVTWQQVGSWVDMSLVPVEIQLWLQPAG